uniref:Ovule protein n=1 Tax=Panagrellus redivivus TaxID=6233 RepID=A0A7E4V401_PANRE
MYTQSPTNCVQTSMFINLPRISMPNPTVYKSNNSKKAVKRYTFNDFCDFYIDIKDHKLFSMRFNKFPIFVSTDVQESAAPQVGY